MTQYKIAIKVELDSSATASGFAATTAGMDRLAGAARKASEDMARNYGRASDALDQVGNRANALGTQLTAAGTKATMVFSEVGASATNAGAQVATATKAMDTGVQRVGLSAKQTAAALRGLPAQMTDIFTSLGSGQNPLTVLLQQGGQLKDMFGGVGNAARAIGGYLVGLISPLTVVLGVVGLVAAGFLAGQQQSKEFNNAIILSGNAAGKTMAQYDSLSSSVAGLAKVSKGAAMEALAQIATRADVGGDALGRMTALAVQLEKVGGPAVGKTAEAFAQLAEKPTAASEKLNQAYNHLQPAVYRRIKALEDEGRQTEAAALAQEAFANALATRIPQMEANVGLLERAWNGVKGAITGAWDALASIGREDTLTQQRSALESNIAMYERMAEMFKGSVLGNAAQSKVDALKQGLAYLGETDRMEKRSAEAAAKAAEETKASAEWSRLVTANLSQQEKLQREIATIRQTGGRAGMDAAAIEKEVQAARMRYFNGDASNAQIEAIKQGLSQREKLTKDAIDTVNSLYKQQAIDQVEQINRVADAERGQIQASMAALQQEIAIASKKKDSLKEVAALKGELAQKGLELTLRDEKRSRDLQEVDAAQAKRLRDKAADWALESDASQRALDQELQFFGQSAEARTVALAGMKLLADAEKTIADAKRANQPLGDKEAAQLRATAEARALNVTAIAAERQALAGAEQLRLDNKRFAAESILDGEARARALVEIDAQAWRDRIALAGEGTDAQKKLAAEYEVWYRNQASRPALDKARAFVDGMESNFKAGFTRLLEGGKDKWSAFTTSLKNAFKTEVADQIYKFLAKPFVVKLAASLFGLDSTTAAGGGGLLGTLGSAGNLANLGSSLMGGIQSGFAGVTGAIANVLGGATASNAAMAATLTGDIASAQAAAVAAAEAAAAASAAATSAASLGSTVATAAPWVAGALVAYQVADKLFGSKGGPKTESGYGPGVDLRGDPASAKAISEQIQGAYSQLAKTLGLAVKDLEVGVASAIDTAGDSLTQLQVVAVQGGQEIYNRYARLGGTPGAQENVGRSAEAYAAAVAEETARVMAAALQKTDLPQKFKDYLEQATDITSAVQTITTVAQLDKAFASLGGNLAQLAGVSVDAQVKFVQMFGGVENLSQGLSAFFDGFLSEAERTQAKAASVQRALVEMSNSGAFTDTLTQLQALADAPTEENFKRLVQAQDLTTESGRRTYAQLIGLAGAFKDASSGMASYRAAVDQLKAERSTLFVDYLRSLGDELGAVAEETRLATQGFDAVQLGLYSMNEELRRTIAINGQRSQLSSSLASAANVKGYGRDRELAALVDPSSRALQQWIYRIEDAQDAISAAADVNRDAADAARDMQSALQQQRDTAKTTVSELEQQVNQLRQASKGASNLLNDIAVSLGATDGRAAGLRATLASGADIDERLSAARELYDIIKQGDQASLAAQQKQLEAAKGLVAYGRQLQDYVAGLKTSDLSPLKPEQQLAEARDAFQALVQQAQAGDADARSKLQGASDTYLKLAQAFDPEGYATTVFANVSSTLDQLGAAAQTSGQAQVDLLSDLVDASGSNNKLSADQVAQLADLQRTVERLYGEAASGAATSGAQLAVANASLASIESQLAASESAVQALEQATKESVKAAENRLAQVQTEAAQYLASVQLQVLATDPVPGLLAGLPGGIANALAPLINGTANVGSSAGGFDAGRAQTIRAYAATLSNDEAGAMAMYRAAVNNGVSSAELEAALNLPAGGANEWAKARGLPAFALGGIAGPGDALVGENGPEVVRFLQPAEVYRTGTGPSAPVDLQPLLAEMASLRAEVRRLREQNNRGHEVNAVATQATGQAMAQALERGAAKGTRAGLAAAVGVPT